MKKYINFDDGSFKIFSDDLMHDSQCDGKSPASAGFVLLMNGAPHCFGESTSLNLESAPTDSEELTKWLSGDS